MFRYSFFIILQDSFIDNQNSFLNREIAIFDTFKEKLLFENTDEKLHKLFEDFEQNKDSKLRIWLDFGDYDLAPNIEKIYIYKENSQN